MSEGKQVRDTFHPAERISAMVDAVWEFVRDMHRGQVITHQRIEEATGLCRYDPGWNTVIVKLKRKSEKERGITLWAETDVGYKLLTVPEQLNVARKRQAKATRQLRKGARSLEALPVGNLSLHQQNVRDFRLNQLKESRRLLQRQQRQEEVLSRRTDTGVPWSRQAPAPS